MQMKLVPTLPPIYIEGIREEALWTFWDPSVGFYELPVVLIVFSERKLYLLAEKKKNIVTLWKESC